MWSASSAAKSSTRPARHAEAAQARDAGGDGDGDVEEGLAAFGLAADDADGLLGPQAGDEPAVLLAALIEAPGGLDGNPRLLGHELLGGLVEAHERPGRIVRALVDFEGIPPSRPRTPRWPWVG
jgi:hypothetical protein